MTLMTKSQIMKLVASGAASEVFDHETEGSFNVTEMRRLAQNDLIQTGLVMFAIEGADAALRATRVIDEKRIDELTLDQADEPVLVVLYPEANGEPENHLLIDGVHRVLRRHKEGAYGFEAYVFTPDQVVRPDFAQVVRGEKLGVDWGDTMLNGKIIKRT